jgi:hypothetical protein
MRPLRPKSYAANRVIAKSKPLESRLREPLRPISRKACLVLTRLRDPAKHLGDGLDGIVCKTSQRKYESKKHDISPKSAGCAGMVLLMVVVSSIIGFGMWVLPG